MRKIFMKTIDLFTNLCYNGIIIKVKRKATTMKIKVNEVKESTSIKYYITTVSNDKFYLYFSSFNDSKIMLRRIKNLWGVPNGNVSEFGINFMGETWKVKTNRLYHYRKNEVKLEDAIIFERVEQLYYEDSISPRLTYMVGILEECFNLEKA